MNPERDSNGREGHMKKSVRLRDLNCAHCAAKMEQAIRRIDGVQAVNVNFLLQKLTIEAEDARIDAVLEQAARACKRIEPGCRVEL